MACGEKKRYRLLEHLAARRNDPERRKTAEADAAAVARFLKERYGAVVFGIGSLFESGRPFSVTSDIDLVVEGLPKSKFFAISAEAQELSRIPLDIIPYEDANELIRETVREIGVEL